MKTIFLIIIGVAFIPSLLVYVSAQYMGNSNQYVGNYTMLNSFPTEPLSVETLDEIEKIILSDDMFQYLVDGKSFLFYDGNAYTGSTETEKWNPIILININNETTVSMLFDLKEKKILKIILNKIVFSYPPTVLHNTNINDMFDRDTEPGSIEEKLEIARKPMISESNKPDSSQPFVSVDLSTPIIAGIMFGIGSFFGLMIYLRKRK